MEGFEKLRRFALGEVANHMGPNDAEDFMRVIDEIEREHKDELISYRNAGFNDGWDAGFASADDWMEQHDDDMIEHGWVRLPMDADGVPIRIGDKVNIATTVVWTVTQLRYANGSWQVGCTFENCTNYYSPKSIRHAKPDSWERIIEDATALGAQMGRRTVQVDDFVARCKALAGEE